MPTESELKIPVDDLGAVRVRLEAAGARCTLLAAREVNVVFDAEDHRLENAEELLRLRRYAGRWILTFKGAPTFDGAVKNREELELEVSSGETLIEILDRLGYRSVVRYEKDRELWLFEGVVVTLDRTPMGLFVELEGEVSLLEGLAARLGLEPEAAVRGSYLDLWERHRELHPELDLAADMVFES